MSASDDLSTSETAPGEGEIKHEEEILETPVMQFLYDYINGKKLLQCVLARNLDQFTIQLKKTKFVNFCDSLRSRTALHWAALSATTRLQKQKPEEVAKLVEIVSLLLENGADPNCRDHIGYTAMHFASLMGNTEILLALLNTGKADVNAMSDSGRPPLMLAALSKRIECVKILLASPEIDVTCEDQYNRTPLHFAAEMGSLLIVKSLVNKGKSHINARDKFGQTPLSYAVACTHPRIVRFLLSKGANTNVKNNEGETLLTVAAKKNHQKFLHMLLENGADPLALSDNGIGPIHAASMNGCLEAIDILINHGGKDLVDAVTDEKQTSLHLAVIFGHFEVVQKLLSYGADPRIVFNWKDQISCASLLDLAKSSGDRQTIDEIRNQLMNVALWDACSNLDAKKAESFIRKGADINFVREGLTPLHLVCLKEDEQMIRMLIKFGANPGKMAILPLHHEYLDEMDVDDYIDHSLHGDPNIVTLPTKALLNEDDLFYQENCELLDNYGVFYLLIESVKEGSTDEFDNLLTQVDFSKIEHKINAPTGYLQNTALHVASENGHAYILKKLLTMNGINVNVCNEEKETALFLAAKNGHEKCVEALLASDANVQISNKDGKRPFDIAMQNHHIGVAAALKPYHSDDISKDMEELQKKYVSITCVIKNMAKEIKNMDKEEKKKRKELEEKRQNAAQIQNTEQTHAPHDLLEKLGDEEQPKKSALSSNITKEEKKDEHVMKSKLYNFRVKVPAYCSLRKLQEILYSRNKSFFLLSYEVHDTEFQIHRNDELEEFLTTVRKIESANTQKPKNKEVVPVLLLDKTDEMSYWSVQEEHTMDEEPVLNRSINNKTTGIYQKMKLLIVAKNKDIEEKMQHQAAAIQAKVDQLHETIWASGDRVRFDVEKVEKKLGQKIDDIDAMLS